MAPKLMPRRQSTAAFTGKAALKIRTRVANKDDEDGLGALEHEDGLLDLDREVHIMLSATNPNVDENQVVFNHKEMCYEKDQQLPIIIHFSTASCVEQKQDKDQDQDQQEDQQPEKAVIQEIKLQNQFNFSERSTQTPLISYKTKKVQTEPPIKANFAANALQCDIYDFYTEDVEKQEKGKELDKDKSAIDNVAITRLKPEKKLDMSNLLKSARIVERIVNQNTYDEISQDFRYWEDLSDEFKNGQGSALPLWKFNHDEVKDLAITSIKWSPRYDDMFVTTYGSFNFMNQKNGFICMYSLCNPTHPEYTFASEVGIMSIDLHSELCHLIVCGFYDGNVGIYNVLKQPMQARICHSLGMTTKHSDVVWKVQWHTDDLDGNQNFHSISADGYVIHWTLVKNFLRSLTILTLKLENVLPDEVNLPIIPLLGTGTTFAFHPQKRSVFLVGTGDGRIYLCNKAYTDGTLMEYEKHHQAVYQIIWNSFHPDVFATCSPDGTVRVWIHEMKEPVCTYDLQSPVGDVQWAPYASTVFAAVTSDGKVHVYDLNVNKYAPICVQTVVPKQGTQLTSITFSRDYPIILVGDDRGCVRSLKLSPNLRKAMITGVLDEQQRIQEVTNLDKYLAVLKYRSGVDASTTKVALESTVSCSFKD